MCAHLCIEGWAEGIASEGMTIENHFSCKVTYPPPHPGELKTKKSGTLSKYYSEKGKMILTNGIKIPTLVQLFKFDF